MILNYNNTTVDYFDKLPTDLEHVAVSTSGGLDSALALYCLAKEISDRKQYTTEIHPYHLFDLNLKKLDTRINATDVVNYVSKSFPDVTIHPLRMYDGDKRGNDSKIIASLYAIIQLCDDVPIDWLMSGQNLSDYVTIHAHEARTRAIEQEVFKTHGEGFPWKDVGKDFIAAQYKALGIEDLSLITNSCISDNHMGMPCKTCRWCKDRYLAFGNYDYGFK